MVGPGAQEDDHEVRGNDFDIHKVKAGGWANKSTSNPPENTWEKNAKLVAEDVTRAVRRTGAAVVAVTGDVRAVTDLRERAPRGESPASSRSSRSHRSWTSASPTWWRRTS